ncbi:hypothetical protein CF319_g4165 [Tilletia indica]|nr:hypothetical protein CF319_g4165 [Tilletia indica]
MSMAIEEQRIASFTTTRPAWPHPTSSASTSRSKASSARSHQYPLPEQLAAASFYFSPSPDAPDNCTSFVDGTNIADWMAGDDPIDRLVEVKPNHPWIFIMRSAREAEEHEPEQQQQQKSFSSRGSKKAAPKRGKSRGDKTMDVTVDPDSLAQFSWENADLVPNSKVMTDARKATFGKEWPHDAKRGWSCTSAKVAAAGFHYDPSVEEPDNAACAYCKKALAGWEKGDDPIYEHQRRRPECPFFNVRPHRTDGGRTDEEEEEEIKVVEPERSVRPRRAQAKAKVIDQQEDVDGEEDEVEEVVEVVEKKKKSSTPVKSKAKAKVKARAPSPVEIDDDEEEDRDDGPSRILPNNNHTELRKSNQREEVPPEKDDEEPILPPLPTTNDLVTEADLSKTVDQYLREKTNEALEEMRAQGEAKLQHLRKRVFSERKEIEAILNGKRKVVRRSAAAGEEEDVDDGGGRGVGSSRDRDGDVFGEMPGVERKATGVEKKKGSKAKGRPKLPAFESTPP